VAGCCERGDEPSNFIISGEFLSELREFVCFVELVVLLSLAEFSSAWGCIVSTCWRHLEI
jgi:hypothetical protein